MPPLVLFDLVILWSHILTLLSTPLTAEKAPLIAFENL